MTLEEWWVAYCLRFGPEQLRRAFVDGEAEFLAQVIAEHFSNGGLAAEGLVITSFSRVQAEAEQMFNEGRVLHRFQQFLKQQEEDKQASKPE